MTRIAVALSALNLIVLAALGAQLWPAEAQGRAGIIRGSGIEIVDDAGRIRASLSILPAAEGSAETVLFRLINAEGQPSVKIGASDTTSGLSFVGGDDESYLILEAKGPDAMLKLVEQQTRETLLSPE
jgi:hypothetical protein